MKYIKLLIILVIPAFAFGQKNFESGYVITTQMDTLLGWVDRKIRSDNSIRFQAQKEKSNVQYFFPNDILEAKAGDKYVKRITIKDREGNEAQIFVWKLVSGKINLFFGYSEEKGKMFFINREGHQELTAVDKKNTKAFLQGYFKDCPEVANKVRFDYRSLYEAISRYNACLYGSSELFIHEKLPERPRIGVSVEGIHSIQNHSITGWHGDWFGREKTVTHSNQRPAIGFVINFDRFIALKTSFSILNIGFKDELYSKRIFVTGGYHDYESEISVSNLFLEVPVQASFNFIRRGPFRVGVSGGYNMLIPMKYKPEVWGEPVASTANAEPLTLDPVERSSIKSTSLFAGLGMAYSTKGNNHITLNGVFAYDNMKQSFTGKRGDEWNIKRLEFKIGYTYFFKSKN